MTTLRTWEGNAILRELGMHDTGPERHPAEDEPRGQGIGQARAAITREVVLLHA
jgi:hypothetical protein